MKIRGNTVGDITPKTNYKQTNPNEADYLEGKDELDQKIASARAAGDDAMKKANTKAETKTYKGTLLANGWSASAPFTQSVTIDGILSTDYPFVDIDLSEAEDAQSIIEAWNVVGRITVSGDNTIVGYCYEEAPAVDIPMVFKVVR